MMFFCCRMSSVSRKLMVLGMCEICLCMGVVHNYCVDRALKEIV